MRSSNTALSSRSTPGCRPPSPKVVSRKGLGRDFWRRLETLSRSASSTPARRPCGIFTWRESSARREIQERVSNGKIMKSRVKARERQKDAGALDGEPGANRDLVARKGFVAAVNKCTSIRWKTGELCPPEESVKHVGGHGVARFDFHRVEKVRFLD